MGNSICICGYLIRSWKWLSNFGQVNIADNYAISQEKRKRSILYMRGNWTEAISIVGCEGFLCGFFVCLFSPIEYFVICGRSIYGLFKMGKSNIFLSFLLYFLNLPQNSENKLNIRTSRMIFSKEDALCPEVDLSLILSFWGLVCDSV